MQGNWISSKDKGPETVLGGWLPGGEEQANQARVSPIRKSLAKEFAEEGRSYAKEFGSFLNQQVAFELFLEEW